MRVSACASSDGCTGVWVRNRVRDASGVSLDRAASGSCCIARTEVDGEEGEGWGSRVHNLLACEAGGGVLVSPNGVASAHLCHATTTTPWR